MTVQDIVNSVSNDMRQVLSNASPDADIIIPWVDRIHKDALHTSLFNYLLRGTTTVSVVSGTASYSLSPGEGVVIRRILSVYDRTFDRIILPYDGIAFPLMKADAVSSQSSDMPKPMLSAVTMREWPEYYMREGTGTIWVFPAPQKTAFNGTYEIHYEQNAPDLVNLTDTLLIPDDGEDLVVAGVNILACQYLKNEPEAQLWQQAYETMKRGAFVV